MGSAGRRPVTPRGYHQAPSPGRSLTGLTFLARHPAPIIAPAMSVSTSGVELPARSRALRDAIELLSSMRFAISLFAVICIASVIGTVVKQGEPFNNYVNQFGPFWAEVFRVAGLYTVYSAWWFLGILAFLVISTSLCIARTTPKILADLKNFKEHVREQSLAAFHHKAQGTTTETPDAALARVQGLLAGGGWKAKAQVRERGTMVAARAGASNKLGYIAAHGAIVLICLGGLADGDMIVRAQMALLGKTPFTGGGLVAEVPDAHRLSVSNPTYRANLFVPEGQRAGVAVLNVPGGVVLQDLPFDVELKRFRVEYYETGMPKLFASDIVIHDRETGETREATVEVNKPAHHRGVAIYQSSFDDGGSRVALRAQPLDGGAPFEIKGEIGGKTELVAGDLRKTLEFAALRVINVENVGDGRAPAAVSGADPRRVDLASTLDRHLGSGAGNEKTKDLRNIGPSITYRLRDDSGQAREFHNYMLPVLLDGRKLFLMGVRDTPQEEFRYLRAPADENGSLEGWLRLRRALADPALRDEAARRYAQAATPDDKPEMGDQLRTTAQRVLGLFAGVDPQRATNAPAEAAGGAQPTGGLQALADFMEATVPEADRARISEVLLRVLSGSLVELANLARAKDGLKPMPATAETETFMTGALTSLSDSYLYPAPLVLQLEGFTQIQASVFQVARAPGQTLVYLGSVLLIIGVFAMLYVRERRLWIWIEGDGAGGTKLTAALSTTRRTLDADTEFERIRSVLLQSAAPGPDAAKA